MVSNAKDYMPHEYVVAEWPPTGRRYLARIDPVYGVVVICKPEIALDSCTPQTSGQAALEGIQEDQAALRNSS
jgi:hypothetical protein